jgi:integrase
MLDHDLSKKSTLNALEARREPYWNRVQGVDGLYLGYRKLAVGGTWVARWRTDEKKQKTHSLGSGPTYDQAINEAKEWARNLAGGVETVDLTVGDVCRAYVEWKKADKTEKAAKDAEGRFKRLVYGKPISKALLTKLKTTSVRSWLNAQVVTDGDEDEVRRSRDSANRNLAALKAALNHALKERLVVTDEGWKTVTPFKGVGAKRDHFLTTEQRKKLLEACPDDLRSLVTALLLTPARPGEIASATAQDFDRRNGAITLRGKTGQREVTLSSQAVEFFAEQARGKIGNAPLLTRADGQSWNKDSWKRPFKAALKKAGLPVDMVAYSLRHTAISQLIQGGVDVFLIAKMAGTSVAMIEKHYGHLRHDHTRQRLDRVQSI